MLIHTDHACVAICDLCTDKNILTSSLGVVHYYFCGYKFPKLNIRIA